MKEGFITEKRLSSFLQEDNPSKDILVLDNVSLFKGNIITLDPKYFIPLPEPPETIPGPRFFMYEDITVNFYVNKLVKLNNQSFLDYFNK